MSSFFVGVAAILVLNLGGALLGVVRGPTPFDRMVVGQLFGTTGVAVLLLLAEASGRPALRSISLAFALLSAVVSVAFVKRGWIRIDVREREDTERGIEDA